MRITLSLPPIKSTLLKIKIPVSKQVSDQDCKDTLRENYFWNIHLGMKENSSERQS